MIFERVKLSNFCSFRLGGLAKLFSIKSEDDLVNVIKQVQAAGLRTIVLGEGTNTFFADDLDNNLLILKMELKGVDAAKEKDFVYIKIKAGEIFDDIVKLSVKNNWWGIENLSYIPGTVGAAPVQNIGAYGVELKDVLEEVKAFDLFENKFKIFKNKDCNFSYRDSLFKKEKDRYIICELTLKLSKIRNPVLNYKSLNVLNKENVSVEEIRNEVIRIRKEKLPDYKEYPNCGSFFKNVIVTKEKLEELKIKYPNIPSFLEGDFVKIPTAWLIDNIAKMKGVRIGNVGTWPSQPLVLVNYGTESAEEINNFEEEIRKKIFDETGIIIEREVNFVK